MQRRSAQAVGRSPSSRAHESPSAGRHQTPPPDSWIQLYACVYLCVLHVSAAPSAGAHLGKYQVGLLCVRLSRFSFVGCVAEIGGFAALELAAVTWSALCAAGVSGGHSRTCFPLRPLFERWLRLSASLVRSRSLAFRQEKAALAALAAAASASA